MTHATPPATVVQFNLRSLLVAMLVFIFVVAASTPLLRTWNETMQRFFLLFVSLNLAATGIGVLLNARRRRRVERIAGAVLLRVFTRRAKLMRIGFFLMAVVMAALLALWSFGFALMVDRPPSQGFLAGPRLGALLAHFVALAAYAYLLATYFCFVWWNTGPWTVEVCDNGLIFDALRMQSWADVIEIRWGTYFPNTLQIKLKYRRWTDVAVPTQQRETVESIFRERIAAARAGDASPDG